MICEKCWEDAYARTLLHPNKSQGKHYVELLKERKDAPCKTPHPIVYNIGKEEAEKF